jgi:hypothetical protein
MTIPLEADGLSPFDSGPSALASKLLQPPGLRSESIICTHDDNLLIFIIK